MTGLLILAILAIALILTITNRREHTQPWHTIRREPPAPPEKPKVEIWADEPCIVMHPDTAEKLMNYCGKSGEPVSIRNFAVLVSPNMWKDRIYINDTPPALITDFALKYNLKVS